MPSNKTHTLNIKIMSTSTDKSDTTLLSSSNNTAVDDMLNGIKKVTLEDVSNKTPPRDIIGGEEEDMNSEKKCTSCEQKLEHNMYSNRSGWS